MHRRKHSRSLLQPFYRVWTRLLDAINLDAIILFLLYKMVIIGFLFHIFWIDVGMILLYLIN